MRLADRRGLLHGCLNPVQNYALKMLMAHERIEANSKHQRDQQDSFRQRLAAADFDRWFAHLYPRDPQQAAAEAVQKATRADGTIDTDKVDMDAIPDAPAPQSDEEREQLKRWIEEIGLGTVQGQVTGADVINEWGEWQ